MSARAYRVGVIGLGRIASLLEDDPLRGKPATLAGAFAAHPKARIVAGCDINPERRRLFARRWGVKKLYADFHGMLARERLDIVAVASWTETHAEAVIAAARAGARGIYCEKPIAINLAQARRMIAACRRSGAAMVVGHERRWARPYRAIREALRAGLLGELRSLNGVMRCGEPPTLSRRAHGGGPMFHDGTHLIDLFHYYAGPARAVRAIEDRPWGKGKIERSVDAIIEFGGGVTGHAAAGGRRGYFHFELDIQTDRFRAILGNHTAELYETRPSGRYSGFMELARVPFPQWEGEANPYVGAVDGLIRAMETGEPPLSSGEDGLMALETIMAMYRSAAKGGAPVRLPLR